MKHYLKCNAPICQDSTDEKDVVWYAGEEVCKKTPHKKFQKKQLDINHWVKLGKFKHLDVPYTKYELEHKSI